MLLTQQAFEFSNIILKNFSDPNENKIENDMNLKKVSLKHLNAVPDSNMNIKISSDKYSNDYSKW